MTEQKLNYRNITKHISGKLKPLEAYAFYCLAMKSDFETYESHITQESLAQYYGIKDTEQIRKYLKAMESHGLVKITANNPKGQYGTFVKYSYILDHEDYVWITGQLHDEPIKRELKGFLILLRCLCYSTLKSATIIQYTIKGRFMSR